MFEKYTHPDIELSLLSRFLSYPSELMICYDLSAKHFVWEENQKVFNAMIELSNKGIPMTPKNIWDITNDKEHLQKVIKADDGVKAIEYAKYLIEETEKYNALNKMQDIISKANDDKNVDIFQEVQDISVRDFRLEESVSDEQMLYELEDKMKNGITGISTTIPLLDDSINAFQKGRLYIVGARPSMGKSAFMCSLVEKIEKNNNVGIISLEMQSQELRQRIACIRGNIKHWKIEKGRCTGDEFDEYAKNLCSIKNITINDKGGLTRNQVASIIRNMVIRKRVNIVFIDHLGLIKVAGKNNLAFEIGENTSMLKALSKELQIPIVCLCQINRAVDKEKDKVPQLSSLRDSGRIEEDADCVILLYRDSYYDKNIQSGKAAYVVAKCRNGKTGAVDGYFDCELMKWS